MHHPITTSTVRLSLAARYDYLSAGVEYLATPVKIRSGKRKGQIEYWRVDRADGSSGTFLRPYQWRELERGTAGAVIADA